MRILSPLLYRLSYLSGKLIIVFTRSKINVKGLVNTFVSQALGAGSSGTPSIEVDSSVCRLRVI